MIFSSMPREGANRFDIPATVICKSETVLPFGVPFLIFSSMPREGSNRFDIPATGICKSETVLTLECRF